MSDSHSTFFVENKVAVLCEERLLLAVFSPTAFCKVTGLYTAASAAANTVVSAGPDAGCAAWRCSVSWTAWAMARVSGACTRSNRASSAGRHGFASFAP